MTRSEDLRRRWPLPDEPGLRDRLLAAYGDPARGYHDLRHLGEVLDRVAELGAGDDLPVVLAAWFHDAVYEGSGEDEERSALLAEETLGRAGLPGGVVAEVKRLVRLTAEHRPRSGDRNGEVLSDADLAILAAPAARYREYAAGVRREYAEVPDADFRRGRAGVLSALLAKPTLFHTARGRREWEPRARANVEAELAELAELAEPLSAAPDG